MPHALATRMSHTTYYDFELFCLFVRFWTGCRARSPGKSGRGPAPGSSVHYPAVPSDARRRGAAGSARKAARTGSISRGRFFHHPRIYGERALFFCGEIMTQRPATAGPAAAAAAAAVHRATNCLQRYNATAPSSSRQHHARVTGLRCTVSSCFGRHLRSITYRIYSYQRYISAVVEALLLRSAQHPGTCNSTQL